MKKKTHIILLLFTLIIVGCVRKELKDSDFQMLVVNDTNQWIRRLYGYKDLHGNVLIKPQFTGWSSFSEGVAAVRDNKFGLYGYIDHEGKWVIEPQYKYASAFSDGFAPVADSQEKWGYIDHTGKYLLKPQFDRAYPFKNGCAVVNIGATDLCKFKEGIGGLFGMIDRTGKLILPTEYSFIDYPRGNDLIFVSKGEYCEFPDGPFYVGQCGYVNTKGELIIPLIYDIANHFVSGLACVQQKSKWGLIDSLGKVVAPLQYDSVWIDEDRNYHLLEQGKWFEFKRYK